MDPWTPDVELNDEIARSLIELRFPGLCPVELRLIGKGWDNHAYLVNGGIVFRIPHRRLGGELMETECAILRGLTEQELPLRIPAPSYEAPPGEFPYRIAGYPLIQGTTADQVVWQPEARAANAAAIGRFLGALHRVSMSVPNAPGDEIKRADLAYRLPKVQAGLTDEPAEFGRLLEDLAGTAQWPGPPVWVHGDLYVRHLVVDDKQTVSGVIDWGDAHLGDPALDLSIAWSFLPVSSHGEFRRAYGEVDEATWRRARFRAMSASVYLGNYARKSDDEHLARECAFIRQNVLNGV